MSSRPAAVAEGDSSGLSARKEAPPGKRRQEAPIISDTTRSIYQPVPLDGPPSAALVALNNAHAAELSYLSPARFARLADEAFLACRIGEADALLIAFDEAADYDSPNFLWFRDRFGRFVYVDRIVVAPEARGRGLARRLYETLFERARSAGHQRVVCEVNADPPNTASDAFHAALGFVGIGSALLANGKTVRYFERPLA